MVALENDSQAIFTKTISKMKKVPPMVRTNISYQRRETSITGIFAALLMVNVIGNLMVFW